MAITLKSAEVIGLRRRIRYLLDLTDSYLAASTTISNVTLTQKHNLVVQSLSSATSTTVPSVSQAVFLSVNDLTSTTTINNVGTFGMGYVLSVDNLNTGAQVGNVQLNPYTELVVNNLMSTTSINNVMTIRGRKPVKYWYNATMTADI